MSADGDALAAEPRRLVSDLERTLEATLASLLPRGTTAALINYPNHHNVGDPALYLGTLRVLRRLGVRVSYRCSQQTYSRESLAGVLRGGTSTILINGGGNLGDQYPQQLAREQVLADFPDVPTIQLPQSIWFASQDNLARFAELVARHRSLTLLLRDRRSLDVSLRHFDAPTQLCPDMAVGLGPLPRPVTSAQPIVWLRRTDREAADQTPSASSPSDPLPMDWLTASPEQALGDRPGVWLLRINQALSRRTERYPWLWRPVSATFEPLAKRRLDFGLRMLARGDVVVTDRLHGMLLALLMGIPVVGVDDRTGKVRAFAETWLAGAQSVRLATSHASGLQAARELVESRL